MSQRRKPPMVPLTLNEETQRACEKFADELGVKDRVTREAIVYNIVRSRDALESALNSHYAIAGYPGMGPKRMAALRELSGVMVKALTGDYRYRLGNVLSAIGGMAFASEHHRRDLETITRAIHVYGHVNDIKLYSNESRAVASQITQFIDEVSSGP